jgi:hypothetical protein
VAFCFYQCAAPSQQLNLIFEPAPGKLEVFGAKNDVMLWKVPLPEPTPLFVPYYNGDRDHDLPF